MMKLIKKIKFDKNGLVPAIVQDAKTNQVLMVAYMNKLALRKTLETKKACFWSRSRKQLWIKGESSGHVQTVRGVFLDCDNDTILLKVSQKGAACHTGYYSCFYKKVDPNTKKVKEIGKKVFDPKKVYRK
ncbi:MAG: phosphoribosyl-AMP cyclohydrolase [Candidatus Omnitrophica bacterium]|nr:phosphoribosyl-AMP cyclohydrolase [Candidatus Omnitrophota bacterium]